jgi:hypothetical protein
MFWIWQVLMITARTTGGHAHQEKIEEMDRELTKVIEDFNHAVDVETLRLAKKSGEHSLSLPGDNSCSVAPCRARVLTYASQTRRDRL